MLDGTSPRPLGERAAKEIRRVVAASCKGDRDPRPAAVLARVLDETVRAAQGRRRSAILRQLPKLAREVLLQLAAKEFRAQGGGVTLPDELAAREARYLEAAAVLGRATSDTFARLVVGAVSSCPSMSDVLPRDEPRATVAIWPASILAYPCDAHARQNCRICATDYGAGFTVPLDVALAEIAIDVDVAAVVP